jgi:heat shock protein HslJ
MKRSLIALVALALVASACGGSDTGSSTTEFTGDTSGGHTAPTSTSTTAPPVVTTTTVLAVDAPELGGTDWIITDYELPDGSLTNVWKTEVTISFAADGTVSGSAGCNDYQGSWSVSGAWNEFEQGVPDPEDGQVLTLSDLSWTEMACDDEDIMIQESEILDHLLNAGRWVLIRGDFHLRDAEGSYLFEAEPA